MLDPISVFRDGGPFMYFLLVGFPAGLIVALLGFALSLFRVRVPLFVWALPPVLFASLGLAGTAWGMGHALQAIAYATADMKGTMAAAGHSVALYTAVAGWFGACLLCIAMTWASSLGHLPAGEDDGWDPATAAALALGGFVLGAIVAGLGLSQAQGVMPILIGVATIAAGTGLAPVALRTSEEPESRARLAEGRLVTASLALGAPLCMAAAATLTGRSMALGAVAYASAEMRPTMVAAGEDVAGAAFTTGIAGVAIVGLLGLVVALPRARYVPGLRMGVHLVGGALVLVPLLAAAGWAGTHGATLAGMVAAEAPPAAASEP